MGRGGGLVSLLCSCHDTRGVIHAIQQYQGSWYDLQSKINGAERPLVWLVWLRLQPPCALHCSPCFPGAQYGRRSSRLTTPGPAPPTPPDPARVLPSLRPTYLVVIDFVVAMLGAHPFRFIQQLVTPRPLGVQQRRHGRGDCERHGGASPGGVRGADTQGVQGGGVGLWGKQSLSNAGGGRGGRRLSRTGRGAGAGA